MKRLYILLSFLFSGYVLFGNGFENKSLGISLEYPKNWKSDPVLEVNKPGSIFEAIRNNNLNEFMTLVVYPTINLKVDSSRLELWADETLAAFNSKKIDIKSLSIKSFKSGDWYTLCLTYNNSRVITYNIINNGYSYNISFLSNNLEDLDFDNEVDKIINSVLLTIPSNFKTIKDKFNKLKRNKETKLLVPQDFKLTNLLNKKEMAPEVYSFYQKLIADKNTDYVLVADKMTEQLFRFNVMHFEKKIDRISEGMACVYIGRQFKEAGISYEEIKAEEWEKSPDEVFIHKFKLKSKDVGTTHWIFYCTRNDKTDIIKIQTSSDLANEFESNFYDLILQEVVSSIKTKDNH